MLNNPAREVVEAVRRSLGGRGVVEAVEAVRGSGWAVMCVGGGSAGLGSVVQSIHAIAHTPWHSEGSVAHNSCQRLLKSIIQHSPRKKGLGEDAF